MEFILLFIEMLILKKILGLFNFTERNVKFRTVSWD